jgi:hypothetical protein
MKMIARIQKITLIISIITVASTFFILTVPDCHSKKILSSSNTLIVDQTGSGDFTTIQDAIDTAGENWTIFIKNGTYFGSIEINKSLKIMGESRKNVILRPEGESPHIKLNSSHITFSDFSIIGNEGTAFRGISDVLTNIKIINVSCEGIPIFITFQSALIENITIRNVYSKGGNVSTPFSGDTHPANFSIIDSVFLESYIRLSINRNLTIENSKFLNNKGNFFTVVGAGEEYGYTIKNNKFINESLVLSIYSSKDSVFSDNTILNSPANIDFRDSRKIIKNNTLINITEGMLFGHNDELIIENNLIQDSDKGFTIDTVENVNTKISGNRIFNCTTGILARFNPGGKFDNNELINCGFEFLNTDDLSDIEIDFSNTINGKPIILKYEDSNFIIEEDFGQLILAECSGFLIKDKEMESFSDYPLLYSLKSSNGAIKNNKFYKEAKLQLIDSNGILIEENIFNNESRIILEETDGCVITNNTFDCSNESFLDDGENQWDIDGVGNYWKLLHINDTDGNGIGETPVYIPGGSGVDRYPIVPGVTLEWEILANRATTGEDIPIEITARNLYRDILENLTFSFGNDTAGFSTVILYKEKTTQTVFIPVPMNSTDNIIFYINTTDTLGKNLSIGPETLEVFDNDPPVIEVLSTSQSIQSGENITAVISIDDNIRLDNVRAVLTGVISEEINLAESDGLWYLEVETTGEDQGSVSISIFANDTSGNIASIDLENVTITKEDPPAIIEDLSPETVSTGGELVLYVVCNNSGGISSVKTEYESGGTVKTDPMTKMNYSSSTQENFPDGFDPENYPTNWSLYKINIPIPEDDDSELRYRFIIVDSNMNTINGQWKTVDIIDTIPPEIILSWDIPFNGDSFTINFTVSDNIEVIDTWLMIKTGDSILFNTTETGEIFFDVPLNLSGNIMIEAYGSDLAGNHYLFFSDPIPITDNIKPTCEISGELKGKTGKKMILELVPYDNIGISSLSWNIDSKSGTGDLVEFETDQSGEYKLEVIVEDLSGNIQSYNWTVTIEKSEKESNDIGSTAVVVIVLILVILIILIAVFLISRRKRRPGNQYSEDLAESNGEIEE